MAAHSPLREKTEIASGKVRRPLRLIHVQVFLFTRLTDVVNFEIGVGFHPSRAG
jgi:hypothetical protein